MFKSNAPKLMKSHYPGKCKSCGREFKASEHIYYHHKNNTSDGKTATWHQTCYEQAAQHSGVKTGMPDPANQDPNKGQSMTQPDPNPTTPSAQFEPIDPGNASPDPQAGSGSGGGGEPPKLRDLIVGSLLDAEALKHNFHKAEIYRVLTTIGRGYRRSNLDKDRLAEVLVSEIDGMLRFVEGPELSHTAENRVRGADKLARELLLIKQGLDEKGGPSQGAMDAANDAKDDAESERDAALELMDEAVKKAEAAEGRVVELRTPEGVTIEVDGKHPAFVKLALLTASGIPVLMVGPAGSGKTEGARSLAEEMSMVFTPLSLGPQTTQAQIFGYCDATGNYVATPFRRAFEGGGLILLDELDRCNERVSVTLNAAIANGRCTFPDATVEKASDCFIIAAANTAGHGADRQYVSARQQDAALLDRFAVLPWLYDEQFETLLVEAISEKASDWLTEVRRVRARATELELRYVVSPRASIQGATLIEAGADLDLIRETILYRGWTAEDRTKVEAS